jgi:hypothetical protein
VVPDCGSGAVTYRPDLYAAAACRNPDVSQKTAAALTRTLDEAPAKPAVQEPAPVQTEKPVVLPPVMSSEAGPAPLPQSVAGGCFVPADAPLAPGDVAPYVTGEHYGVAEPEIVGEPLPPMPVFKGQWSDEPVMDPAP